MVPADIFLTNCYNDKIGYSLNKHMSGLSGKNEKRVPLQNNFMSIIV